MTKKSSTIKNSRNNNINKKKTIQQISPKNSIGKKKIKLMRKLQIKKNINNRNIKREIIKMKMMVAVIVKTNIQNKYKNK